MPKAKLPKWLERTPEELAAEEAVQVERRASFTRGKLSDEEQLISRGALLEETARGNLVAAEEAKDKEQIRLEKGRLADALAMQGRHAEAAKHHPDRKRKTELKRAATGKTSG
jgi:hypothetical protein